MTDLQAREYCRYRGPFSGSFRAASNSCSFTVDGSFGNPAGNLNLLCRPDFLMIDQGYPCIDPRPHGIFATRSPKRPNAIGLSVVRLAGIAGNTLEIEDVDILDGTPLLDVKPSVIAFDSHCDAKAGWFDAVAHDATSLISDERFRSAVIQPVF